MTVAEELAATLNVEKRGDPLMVSLHKAKAAATVIATMDDLTGHLYNRLTELQDKHRALADDYGDAVQQRDYLKRDLEEDGKTIARQTATIKVLQENLEKSEAERRALCEQIAAANAEAKRLRLVSGAQEELLRNVQRERDLSSDVLRQIVDAVREASEQEQTATAFVELATKREAFEKVRSLLVGAGLIGVVDERDTAEDKPSEPTTLSALLAAKLAEDDATPGVDDLEDGPCGTTPVGKGGEEL